MTDRGRVYIKYGPADEVEAYPSGQPPQGPYEIWRYRSIEGLGPQFFFFHDVNRDGEYRLQIFNPPPPRAGLTPQGAKR
jgi:hypothetical protein